MLPEGILVSIVLPLRMILQFRQLGMWLESKRASNHAYLIGILVSNKKVPEGKAPQSVKGLQEDNAWKTRAYRQP